MTVPIFFNRILYWTSSSTMRLKKIGAVIAEIIYYHKDIQIITLCEGPIQAAHSKILFASLCQFPWMKRFAPPYQSHIENYPQWGLYLMTDKKFNVQPLSLDAIIPKDVFDKLANRFQLWQINHAGKNKYLALGHFPFSGDEYTTDKDKLSITGKKYCQLINHLLDTYSYEHLAICADFNLNPYLIGEWRDRIVDQVTHNNSILLVSTEKQKHIDSVTVDGILLSKKEKQRRK